MIPFIAFCFFWFTGIIFYTISTCFDDDGILLFGRIRKTRFFNAMTLFCLAAAIIASAVSIIQKHL